jgi:hypothetical protein
MGVQATTDKDANKDLLADVDEQDPLKPADDATEENNETDTEDGDDEGDDETVSLDEKLPAIQDSAIDNSSKIAQFREDSAYILKQLDTPDVSQFETNGLYRNLVPHKLGDKLLYTCSQSEIDRSISDIRNSELPDPEKYRRLHAIESAMAVFNDRKAQLKEAYKGNFSQANLLEWQQVELSFTDEKKGIPGIKAHIPEIWKWCQEQMADSPSLRAKCEDSIAEKVKLTSRAIRELGIDKKLKTGSENERATVSVPAGNAGAKATKRGSSKEPSFTRAQLAEFNKNPSKVSDAMMARIDRAIELGRIK